MKLDLIRQEVALSLPGTVTDNLSIEDCVALLFDRCEIVSTWCEDEETWYFQGL